MIKNYFKIAWRNLLKNKVYSFINITGLAAGMAVALLIGLWVWDEISYDHYHKKHGSIAQVMSTSGTGSASVRIAIPLADELRTAHGSDFKNIVLASRNTGLIIAAGDKKINTTGIWAQPPFPDMFTLKIVKGSSTVLKDPSSVMIASSLAKILFGYADPSGRIIRADNKIDMKVAGVYEDLPLNTSLSEIKIILPWDKYIATDEEARFNRNRWGNHNWQLFTELQEHANIEKINLAIANIPMNHLDAVTDGKEIIFLHPMNKWHLYSDFENGKIAGGKIRFVWLFGIIGSFVLLLACINFVNLSTARSEKRAKEVGIRKAIGSLRTQLIMQFLIESVLVAILSFIVAIGLTQSTLFSFNKLAGKDILMPWGSPLFWIVSTCFTLFTGLISGIYPAFYLSKFKPVKVLKGVFRAGRFAALPRKILVVVQFTVSIILIIATIIVFRQIQYGRNRPVGYSREGLISVMMNTPELHTNYQAIHDELLQTGAAENMTESSSPATDVWSNLIGFEWKGKDPAWVPSFATIAVSHDYGKTIGWKLLQGRDFSRSFPTDSGMFILNEAAVKLTGFKNPVGEIINWEGQDRRIIGVVKDMVMESPYKPIKPTVYFLEYNWARVITLRIKHNLPVREALSKIESVFKRYNPGSPFDYHFADEQYAQKFADDERIGNLATFFAALAIFISCLGLFGLSSFVAEQRTKEIGVRKVLGASVFNLWRLLSKDFVLLVLLSCAIAIPAAYYFMHNWLLNYEYRTEISGWIFVAAASGALIITLLTVSFQSIRAALMNPVKSLRTE